MRRVVIVLTDGLRPDAISPTHMPPLDTLSHAYTMALHAKTVRPSRTAAALTSLATGIAPGSHGLIEPGLAFLRKLITLRPLGRELERAGLPTHIVTNDMNPGERAVVWALASAAGIGKFTARGRCAREVAAAELDVAIGMLSALADDSLMIVLVDHGGRGVTEHDHAEPHPSNDRIPLILAGPDVTRRDRLARGVSLLDVPPTILWWSGVEVPPRYEGRVLSQAFTRTEAAV